MSLFLPQGPGYSRIRPGQPVLVDYAECYNGYLAAETRIFCLGSPSPEMEQAHQAALQIEDAIARELAPGKSCRDIWNPVVYLNYVYIPSLHIFLGECDEDRSISDSRLVLLE